MPIPVHMMNDLSSAKRSTKNLLGNDTMFVPVVEFFIGSWLGDFYFQLCLPGMKSHNLFRGHKVYISMHI